jgi:hypothetical protein
VNDRDIYADGTYLEAHPDWHLADAPGKALDVVELYLEAVKSLGPEVKLVDVGSGVGGYIHETLKLLKSRDPNRVYRAVGFEPADEASRRASQMFPEIEFHSRGLSPTDGPFDVASLIDVLEHLENPREMLRTCAAAARYLIVRQPLLENYSTFRHRNYEDQRKQWGHIAYFNYHSFLDMTDACGWAPIDVRLTPPWSLEGRRTGVSFVKRWFARWAPIQASYFLAPHYLLGAFRRK